MALVTLGQDNSRMKDYFDIWLLSRDFPFDGAALCGAIEAAFVRRRVSLPDDVPVGLTEMFSDNPAKRTQWQAFVRQRVAAPETTPTLPEVVAKMRDFLILPLKALQNEQRFVEHWPPGGPWQSGEASSDS